MNQNGKVVAAVFILQRNGACLLQHRDDRPDIRHPGMWTIPGGHRDLHESDEVCARREVQEETRYVCKDLHPLYRGDMDDGDGEIYTLCLFWTLYDASQTYECLEGQEVKFVMRDQVFNYPILKFLLPFWDQAITELSRYLHRRA